MFSLWIHGIYGFVRMGRIDIYQISPALPSKYRRVQLGNQEDHLIQTHAVQRPFAKGPGKCTAFAAKNCLSKTLEDRGIKKKSLCFKQSIMQSFLAWHQFIITSWIVFAAATSKCFGTESDEQLSTRLNNLRHLPWKAQANPSLGIICNSNQCSWHDILHPFVRSQFYRILPSWRMQRPSMTQEMQSCLHPYIQIWHSISKSILGNQNLLTPWSKRCCSFCCIAEDVFQVNLLGSARMKFQESHMLLTPWNSKKCCHLSSSPSPF